MKLSAVTRAAAPAFALLALAATTLSFSSCRTTEGFGQDLQKVGNKIEHEAAHRG